MHQSLLSNSYSTEQAASPRTHHFTKPWTWLSLFFLALGNTHFQSLTISPLHVCHGSAVLCNLSSDGWHFYRTIFSRFLCVLACDRLFILSSIPLWKYMLLLHSIYIFYFVLCCVYLLVMYLTLLWMGLSSYTLKFLLFIVLFTCV